MKIAFQKFLTLGHHPNDSDDEKLKKSSLLVMSGPFAMAGLVWGMLYFANGLMIPGSIPFSYGLLSISNIIVFGFTKKYKFFRSSQLLLILILPFALQISLGGFVPSSAVMYWAIIAPAGAMFFDSVKRSVYWFAAYLLMVCIAFIINDRISDYVNWDLSDGFVNMLFLMNIIGVSSIVFGILYYFVSKITKLNSDIEKKNLELEEQSNKLKEMDQIKSRFFANISHEFRTPLTLILGLVNKQISAPESSPDPKDSETMKRNSLRLLELINQLLDLSKLESGGLSLKTSRNDIVLFTKNLASQFEAIATGRKIEMTFNGHEMGDQYADPPIDLFFDKEILQKILINLLSNAIKFTSDNGRIAVVVKTEKNGRDRNSQVAIIRVSNTGDRIPKDKLPYIFDRFYQVDSASNRKYEGTGIGLALVKELVELHRGEISVESDSSVSTFTIHLPLNDDYLKEDEKIYLSTDIQFAEERAIQSSQEIGNYSDTVINNPAALGSADAEQIEILIVEDNHDLRSFIKDILKDHYKILEAVDGIDGMSKAETSIPDLIISDVMMPGLDGYELCKQLKTNAQTDHIPIIMLTAKATGENKLEGLEKGADDYLVKPFDEKELLARIRNLIVMRKKLQKKYQGELWLRPEEVMVKSVHGKFLEKMKEVIEKNMDNEAFGVDELVNEIAMSRSQIHRKLKALTGQSITRFIRNYRLYRAADLLKQEASNITEIAYQVGFNSQTYFSSSFHELFGCSPSAYKEQVKKTFYS